MHIHEHNRERPRNWPSPASVQGVAVPGYGTTLPRMALMALDTLDYAPADFAAYGIDFPASIAHSVARRQKEYLYGRVAARLVLRELGHDAPEIPIGRAREPLWPRGIIGSITHNDAYVAAIALRTQAYAGVGIDIESIDGSANQAAIEALVVSAAELAYLRALPGTLALATLLTIVFSAKESLYKAAFNDVGRFFDFSAAHIVEMNTADQSLLLVVQTDLSTHFRRGRVCRIHFGFLAARVVMTAFAW